MGVTNFPWVLVLLATAATLGEVRARSVFNADNCGPNFYGEIIQRSSIGRLREFPWLARLGYRKDGATEFHFQGTLIHPYYVLTTVFAANYNRNSLEYVRLGDYHTGTVEDCQEIDEDEVCAPAVQDITIDYIIKHPRYNDPKLANDVALIKLRQPANVSSEFVRPICVPVEEDFPFTENALLFISAWCGSKQDGISAVPLQFRMQNLDSWSCASKLSPLIDINLHESQFCAVLDLDEKTKRKHKNVSLRGSTGAPLQMLGKNGRFYQVGMSSIGVRNAALDTPYVFVNLLLLADWLEQTVAAEEQNRLNTRVA
ncbi:CLIP domain-containing serine protease B9-like [Wyeomyia smithii]|uniref:CLIP domain-containing serine protease B9-like n=1 Tax=Wyeomyia smithii TaxID=174621 RepID=UPI002467DA0B|nr:CLIP domain-containing serine protease B9-like [Wyeomyia smithii]